MNLAQPNELSLPEAVISAAINGRLTFFIGNGVSRLYGISSWEELADKMLRKLAVCGMINHSLLEIILQQSTKVKISIADHYFKENFQTNKIQNLTYQSILMDGISTVDIHKAIPVYKLIAGCGVKLITTNYDGLLSDALTSQDIQESTIINTTLDEQTTHSLNHVETPKTEKYNIYKNLKDFEISSLTTNNFLLHLHGSLADESTLIASTYDYLNFYNDEKNQEIFKLLFKDQTVVFIGYGLEELEILDLIIRSSKLKPNSSDNSRFFLVLSLLSHEVEVLKHLDIYYRKQLGVTLLPYCRDEKGYFALNDVIEKWMGELRSIIQQPSKIDHFNSLDALSEQMPKGDI